MRNRRNHGRRAAAGAAGAASALAALGLRVWRKAANRPVDSLAMLGAGAVSLVIVVNAVFLQTSPHPTPFFTVPPSPPRAADSRPNVVGAATLKPAEPVPARAAASLRQTVSARRNGPIADLIGSRSRVMAVQRVLSEFGYGQIRPSGILDEQTSAAIEKFEREHKLPVTGRLSDRLFSGLAVMAGRPLD